MAEVEIQDVGVSIDGAGYRVYLIIDSEGQKKLYNKHDDEPRDFGDIVGIRLVIDSDFPGTLVVQFPNDEELRFPPGTDVTHRVPPPLVMRRDDIAGGGDEQPILTWIER